MRKPSEYIPDSLDYSKDEPPTFDRFLKQISTCETLEEAYRIRGTILEEIQRKISLIHGCSPDDIINGTKVSKYQNYINRLQVALSRNDKIIAKLSKKDTKSEKVTLNQVLDDPSLTSYFDDYMDQVGRIPLLQFWNCAVSFQDQLCIEKPVYSLEDELDPSMVETWDWVSVAVNIRDLWTDFLKPNVNLSVQHFVRPEIIPILQNYVDKLDFKNPDSISKLPGKKAVLCVLVALQDVIKTMRDEDFQPFLKSPYGTKMIQRHFGMLQPLAKFLKPRSPEREMRSPERSSMESDRGNEEYTLERRKSVLEGIRRTSKSIIGRIAGDEQRDDLAKMPPRLESVGDHEQELLEALDDQAFEYKKKKSKMEEKLLGLIKRRPKSNEFSASSPMTHRKTKSSDFQTLSPSPSTPSDKKPPPLDIPPEDNQDKEAESFMKLEMEDLNPSPVDDELLQQGQVPPMIILPRAFFELDEKLTRLQKDLNQIEKDLKRNSTNESAIKSLQYAKRGVWHEIQDITAEKQRMEQQEIENIILPKCCSVSIGPSHVVEQEGRDYAVYPIQVSRMNSEGVTSGWIVLRRYSQFLTLHQALKQKFPMIMNGLELPGKLMGLIKRRNTVLESRRVSLQSYLNVIPIN
jgi:sorting nexin-25